MKKALLILLCTAVAVLLAYNIMPEKEDHADTLSLYCPVAAADLVSGGDAIRTVHVDWQAMRDKDVQTQMEEVLRLLMGGCTEKDFRMAMPFGTKLLSCKVIGNTAWVDFSSAYGQMSDMKLTMADYCVALSLVQIPGVYTVRTTVNGRDLAYRDRNFFRADDVLVTSPEDVVRNVAVTLYFPDGGNLAPEERILTIYEGESQTEAVLEALMVGPTNEKLQPLLPEGFRTLGVRVEEGVCYVNIAGESVHVMPASATTQRLIVTGLVRSLCSVRNVKEVQILVDSERQQTFGEVSISQPFATTAK